MLDKLNSFRNYFITQSQILVDTDYVFRKQPNTSNYIAKMLKKDKFLSDNIQNMSN